MPPAAPKPRPLSPHLQIYRPQLTSVLSILHRSTGVALGFGAMIFTAWLVSLAGGAEAYTNFLSYAHTLAGQVVLAGLSVAFFYHFCCGIRHMFWDAGYGLELPQVYRSGKAVLVLTVLFTAAFWLKIYGVI